MSNSMPAEVRAYFAAGRRKIISVAANDDFTLTLSFDNGEKRIYDMNESLKGKGFAPIRALADFRRVYLDDAGCVSWDKDPTVDSNVHWNNKIDLCPDSCYIYSVPVGGAENA